MFSEKKHYAVIIPGLGDHGERFVKLTRNWEKDFDIIPVVHLAPWEKRQETLDKKLDRLDDIISGLYGDISLIGASAGGSLAFNGLIAFSDKVKNAVDLCGRLTRGSERGYRSFHARTNNYPAFAESVERLERFIPELSPELKKRMLITKSWFDELVPEQTTTVKGVQSIRIPFVEHGICIALSVVTSPILGPFARGREVIDFLHTD